MTRIEEERIDEMLAGLEDYQAGAYTDPQPVETMQAILTELKELRAQEGVRVEEDFTNYAYAAEDGWIEWSGGGCPVSLGAKVDYRDRGRQNGYFRAQAGALNWAHGGHSGDIVAYRLSALETEAVDTIRPVDTPSKKELDAAWERAYAMSPDTRIRNMSALEEVLKAVASARTSLTPSEYPENIELVEAPLPPVPNVTDAMVERALKRAPKFWRDTSEAGKHMRTVLTAALSSESKP